MGQVTFLLRKKPARATRRGWGSLDLINVTAVTSSNTQVHTRPSIWTKSRQRGAAKKYLFGNFTARQLVFNEHYLNRAGLRGRKIWLCLCLFVVVYLIALAHLTVSLQLIINHTAQNNYEACPGTPSFTLAELTLQTTIFSIWEY